LKEIDIIKGCKKGNPLAQKAFVDTYSSYLFGVCRRYMRDPELAKDCLQESLVQILMNINKYEEKGKFRSWASKVAAMKCLDILKKEKRHISAEMDKIAEPSRDEEISYRLEKEDVMKFLDTLPEQYRIAINMFLVEGYKHKEIAEVLGVTEGSSRSLVARARKMIIAEFEEEKMQVVHTKYKVEDNNKLKIIGNKT